MGYARLTVIVLFGKNRLRVIYYISNNELLIFLCERKPCNRSPVNYFISLNGLFSRAN